MSPGGELEILLRHRGGTAQSTKISSTRPLAARVLIGKTPNEVLALVPMLFSLCADAHSYAALMACLAALDQAYDEETDLAHVQLLYAETLREHVWRILLDWPVMLDEAADKSALAGVLNCSRRFKSALFVEAAAFSLDAKSSLNFSAAALVADELVHLIDAAVFSGCMTEFAALQYEEDMRSWLAGNNSWAGRIVQRLYPWGWQAAGCNPIAALPNLDSYELLQRLRADDAEAFCLTPTWQGVCFENTPYSLQQSPLLAALRVNYGNGLLARFVALLQEVSLFCAHLRTTESNVLLTDSVGDGDAGLAQVQAARGVLIHALELRDERVYDYRIVAPTEWNFHPQGVAARGLANLRAKDNEELRRQAQWWIQAIDPCVPYRLTLEEI
ncbi:nickel-dependent hydrogenase large subunit [Methylomonas sp. HYX-M1]|uniref:nickel-dependent hydrogenase large subunit n=1 Tax=Methylomonas sp. HYX-M1 TaxID=3139307 RepID=UPI00345B99FF